MLVELTRLQASATTLAGFMPAAASGYVALPGAAPTVLTPLTATLVHAGPLHLGFNLLMLIVAGRAIEPVLGRARFLLLYVVGAYAAAAAQWAAGPGSGVPMIGASGAIAALLAVCELLFARERDTGPYSRAKRLLLLLVLAGGWIGLQIIVGWLASAAAGVSIATAAHVGGFVAGLALTPVLVRPERRLP